MTLWQSILLGIVQGITEFLPVSSSGHLVLVPFLLGWKIPTDQAFIFDVLVQIGTLLAVIVYFWRDLWGILRGLYRAALRRSLADEPDAKLGLLLILATIPAGLAGLLLKDLVEQAFASPRATGFFLLVTAVLLWVAETVGKRSRPLASLTWKDALWIGAAQALSIFPGISRSGSTIAAGVSRHFQRADAGRFSFLMMIPVMSAAGLLSFLDLLEAPNFASFLPIVLAGFITSALVGYACIAWLLRFLNRNSLKGFAYYCLGAGLLLILWTYVF